jgi:hypothetical protein
MRHLVTVYHPEWLELHQAESLFQCGTAEGVATIPSACLTAKTRLTMAFVLVSITRPQIKVLARLNTAQVCQGP